METVICYVTEWGALSVAKGNKVVLSSSKGTRRKKKMAADQLVVFMCRFCGWSPGPPEQQRMAASSQQPGTRVAETETETGDRARRQETARCLMFDAGDAAQRGLLTLPTVDQPLSETGS